MNANHPFGAAENTIMNLDLDPIKIKLMHVASGEGWSLDKTDAVEQEYRRFLCLMKLYPDADMAPLADVDTFWHYHILDTVKYAVDCHQVFGYFLHHDPHVGLEGGAEEQFRLDSGERMRAFYEATFGDAYPGRCATDGQATAYCAGPTHDKVRMHGIEISGEIAYCAGPTHARVLARGGAGSGLGASQLTH